MGRLGHCLAATATAAATTAATRTTAATSTAGPGSTTPAVSAGTCPIATATAHLGATGAAALARLARRGTVADTTEATATRGIPAPVGGIPAKATVATTALGRARTATALGIARRG